MSPVARRKAPTTPVKAVRRRDSGSSSGSVSSSLDLSDDEDGYSAVEDITDSDDDDEEDVNAVEEEHILTEDNKPVVSPRPQSFDFDRDNQHYDDDANDDDDDQAVEGEAYESTSWAGIASDTDEKQVSDFYQEAAFGSDLAVERHVRFDLPSSDSDSTDTEDDHADLFPDIFVSQNSLDPAFRREIEHDPDESSDSGSFWDFNPYAEHDHSQSEAVGQETDTTPMATPRATQDGQSLLLAAPVTAVDEQNEMDGYETDGDTTEEDIPEPPVRRKSRRPSVAQSEFSDSEEERPVKQQRGQPRVGSFNLDRSEKKPIAVLNPHTRKMMIFTPHRRRQLDLSPEQFNLAWNSEVQSSPLVNTSANLMFNAMFSSNTFGDFMHGPPLDASDPFFALSSGGHLADESSSIPSGLEDGDDDEEQKLDISDFIAWDDDNVSAAGDEDDNKGKKKAWSSNVPEPSSEPDTLSHLNSQTVGAFRRNQINQQLILSNQATQDSLAFSGPYNYMALKGLKSDRFDGAGLPLTPMRRHKKQRSDMTRSPLEQVSAKRKASSDEQNGGHKKQRSISDVNYLHI